MWRRRLFIFIFLLIAVSGLFYQLTSFYPSIAEQIRTIRPKTITIYKVRTSESEVLENVDGKNTRSDFNSLQWRSNLTSNHKGGVFCGVAYTKEMAIFNQSSIKPLPQFKNPCWFDGETFRCFPYFFVIGASKTGTSDLYNRLLRHHQLIAPSAKEPNWFSQKLFIDKMTLRQFVDKVYRDASDRILQASRKQDWNGTQVPLITGDFSTTYIFYHDFWPIMPGNQNKSEPVFTNADYIHHFNPNAKIIVSVRNPIERLWSGFLYVSKGPKNAEVFHNAVVKAVKMYQECFKTRSVRSCVYDKLLYLRSTSVPVQTNPEWKCPLNSLGAYCHVHLRIGMYSAFLKDYLKVFPRDQVFFQRLEDREEDMDLAVRDIFRFLEMDDPTEEEMKQLNSLPKANVRSRTNVAVGEMKEETRRLLYDFYKPFNEELAMLAGDSKFNYGMR